MLKLKRTKKKKIERKKVKDALSCSEMECWDKNATKSGQTAFSHTPASSEVREQLCSE